MRKWKISNDQSNASYRVGNEMIYSTEALKSNLCNFNDVYVLARDKITVAAALTTELALKNSASSTKCIM